MVSFENTKVAFAGKSDNELRKARFLFSMLGKKWLVNWGKFFTRLAFSIHLPVKGIIKKTIFAQFVGGESIEESQQAIAYLSNYNIGTILDYSVEGQEDESGFDATEQEILRTVKRANQDDRIPFCVFKVTGLARHIVLTKVSSRETLTPDEEKEWDTVCKRVDHLCREAHSTATPILIDAEESWIQQAIDDLALEMMQKYNREKPVVYHTIQLYRHDRLAYMKELYTIAEKEGFLLGLKLVRGAYMEKERERALEMGYESPIQPDKPSSDRDYDEAVVFCIEHLSRIAVCAGTHNESSSMKLANLMAEKNIPANHPHICFAQLLGMSDHISFNLSQAGFNVAKYVPYGPVKKVLPYLIRRAEENTSVKGQTGRELSLIKNELTRRKIS